MTLTPRRRAPCVPFALKNQTGCALVFHCRVVAANGGKQMRHNVEEAQDRERMWVRMTDGETVPFTFEVHRSPSCQTCLHCHPGGWSKEAGHSPLRLGG